MAVLWEDFLLQPLWIGSSDRNPGRWIALDVFQILKSEMPKSEVSLLKLSQILKSEMFGDRPFQPNFAILLLNQLLNQPAGFELNVHVLDFKI